MSVSTKKSRRSAATGGSDGGAKAGGPSSNSKDYDVRQPVPSFHRSHACRKSDVRRLHRLSAPHVDSFNYFLDVGLSRGVSDVGSCEVDLVDPSLPENRGVGHAVGRSVDTVQFWLENVRMGRPTKAQPSGVPRTTRLLPREARELGVMYAAPLTCDFCYQVFRRDGRGGSVASGNVRRIQRNFGQMPVMVLSKACHLHGKGPAELVKCREEQTEFGGYFIVNGIERCVRLLQVPRANHATSIQRSNYKNRGRLYTDLGVAVRCQRRNGDMSTVTNTLHYLTTGGATLKFVARKQEFLLPVVLVIRALSGGDGGGGGGGGGGPREDGHGITDEELYRRVVQGDESNTFVRARAELLLMEARQFSGMQTPEECLAFVGSRFRLLSGKANSTSDVAIGHYIMNK